MLLPAHVQQCKWQPIKRCRFSGTHGWWYVCLWVGDEVIHHCDSQIGLQVAHPLPGSLRLRLHRQAQQHQQTHCGAHVRKTQLLLPASRKVPLTADDPDTTEQLRLG
jgi:hypothetical protein